MPTRSTRRRPGVAVRALGAVLAAALISPAPAAATTVCIDPGHGGPFSNANANGLREKDVNLSLARALDQHLTSRGLSVVMTRDSDTRVGSGDLYTWNWNQSAQRYEYARDGRTGIYDGIPRDDLQARCDIANASGADIFISIHCNGASSPAARGTEDYASSGDPLGQELAGYVQRAVLADTTLHDRGVHTAEYYVLRWSNMPAILVEAGFITNPGDAYLLRSSWFRSRYTNAIAKGISSWLATKPFDRLWTRRSGVNSTTLAAQVSAADFPSGASSVVIARGDRWNEAPGAAALASRIGAPLLFVGEGVLPPATADELKRLDPDRVLLAGLNGRFSPGLTDAIAKASEVATSAIERIGGTNSRQVAANVATRMGMSSRRTIVVAPQYDAEALLQATAYAARARVPLLICGSESRGADAEAFIAANRDRIDRTIAFGSPTSLRLSAIAGLPGLERVYRPDRAWWATDTAFRLAGAPATGTMRPVVVNAKRPADRIVAASHAGRVLQPLLLVEGPALPNRSRVFVAYRERAIGGFEILDGAKTIPLTMDWCLKKAEFRRTP